VLGKPSKRLKKQLEENGVRTNAKVLEIAEKGMAVTHGAEGVISNTELALKCRLEVQPPDGTPAFEVTERFRFAQLAVPSAGMTIPVIYDPNDHDKLILDDSPEAQQNAVLSGAGIDPNAIQEAMQAAQQWQQAAGQAPGQVPGVISLGTPGAAPAPAQPVQPAQTSTGGVTP